MSLIGTSSEVLSYQEPACILKDLLLSSSFGCHHKRCRRELQLPASDQAHEELQALQEQQGQRARQLQRAGAGERAGRAAGACPLLPDIAAQRRPYRSKPSRLCSLQLR